MALDFEWPGDEPAGKASASKKTGGSVDFEWPTEPLKPEYESGAWTLYEAAKMTAKDIGGAVVGAGKAVADVILPPDPTKPSLGERVVQGAQGALTPPVGMEAGLKGIHAGVDEDQFQTWYKGWAARTGISPNPDDPQHKYDYRAAFKAGVEPTMSPEDNRYHWPSAFKAEDHPNRYVGGVDTKTGKPKPTVSTDVVERPAELQGPEAILEGARRVAGTTGDIGPAQKGKRDPRRPELSYTVFDTAEDTARKVLQRSAMGFAQGVWGTAKGLVAVEPLLESLVGLETPIGKLAKENVLPRIDEIIDTLSPDDPNFVDALASGIGSMATFFVPGMATAKIMQGIAKASPTLALWAGTGVHTVLEAGVEAGNSYAELSKAGYSEAEAARRANRVFWQNVALLAVTNKLGIYGEGRGIPKRTLMSALMEGTQEFTQEVIQSRQEDPDSIFADPVFTRERLKRYLESGAVGAIIGGGIGGVRAVSEQRSERAENKEEYARVVPDARAKVTDEEWGWLVQRGKAALLERGYSETDATLGAEVGAARYVNMSLATEEAGAAAEVPAEAPTPAEAGEAPFQWPEESPEAQPAVTAAPGGPSEAIGEAPHRPPEAEVAPVGPGEVRTPGLPMPVEPGGEIRQAESSLGPGATPAEIEAEVNRIMGVPVETVPAEAPGAAAAVGETGPEAPAPLAPETPGAPEAVPVRTAPKAPGPAAQEGEIAPKVAKPEPVFKQVLYRGAGAPLEKVYGPERVAAGSAVPVMGRAKYYAMTEEDARFYGDEIATEEVGLHNPLVLDDDSQWRPLLRAAGVEGLHSTSREQFDHPELVKGWTEQLQKYIKDQGYDGVVVKLTSRAEGDQTRRMNETFGHSQVIKFATKAEDAVARALARAEAKKQPAPAPEVPTREQRPKREIAAEAEGSTGEAVTAAGTKVPFRWLAVEIGDLRTPKDPGFPPEYQPREVGTRAQYEAQEFTIAGGLDPEQLGESRLASQGAPMVDAEGNVISGNRRTEALRKVYGPDARYDEQRANYVEWLAANREKFGISRADLLKLRNPILVRMITDPTMDLERLAQEANVSSVSMMSAQELAGIDAGNLTPKTMALFQPSETGQIQTAQNRDFIRSFIAEVIPAPERGRYLTAEGGLNQDGLARIRNALFAKAYPGGPKLIALLAEQLESNVANVITAMQNVTPRVIAVEGRISTIAPQLMLSQDIASAVVKLSELRGSADPDALKNYLGKKTGYKGGTMGVQGALIADESITPAAKSVLALFDAQAKSAKRITQTLLNYYERVDAAVADPAQGELGGLPPQDLTKDNFWEAAVRKAERDAPQQSALYPAEPGGGEPDLGAAAAPVPKRRGGAPVAKPAVAPAVEPGRGPAAPPAVPAGEVRGGETTVRTQGPEVAPKVFDDAAAAAAKARLLARLKKPTEEMAVGGAEEDALLDDLIEYGGSVYEGGVRDLEGWSAQMRQDLGPDVEEYLEPAFAWIQARMEAARGQATPRPVPVPTPTAAIEAPAPSPGAPRRVEGPPAAAEPSPGGPELGRAERPGDERTRRIITARTERTKPADTSGLPQRLAAHLDADQQQGVVKAITSLEARNSFMNADMTGVGKTRQELAIASIMAERGFPVLIVSPAEVLKMRQIKDQWVVSGSFLDDSKTMGIPIQPWVVGPLENGRIYVTPYSRFHKVDVPPNLIVIFDESHRLKNAKSGVSKTGMRIIEQAAGSAFFSATPADMAQHVHYMVRAGLFGNKTVEQVYKDLGLIQRTQKIIGGGSVMIWEVNPNLQTSQVLERMEKAFGDLTEQGALIKREIAMDGVEVNFVTIPVNPEARMIQNKIEAGYKRAFGDNLNGLRKAQMYLAKRRQLEPYKVEQAVAAVKKSLDENRQAIVFISRINFSEVAIKQKIRNRYGEVVSEVKDVIHEGSEGTVKSLRAALEKLGIREIAELHGNSPTSGAKAMEEFQSGKAKVMLATIESGGTGINLDDRVGNAPRDMVIVTSPFSAVETIQAVGRIWRKTTKSYPRVTFLFADEDIDVWNAGIAARKMKMLGAIVSGDVPKLDVSVQGMTEGDFTGSEEMAPEERMVLPGEESPEPMTEGMATASPATAPPPRGTLGGLFRGRQAATGDPRKDQLIQALGKAVRMARAGALIVQGDVRGKGALGWRHRISGNIHLRKGTDVDTAAHEVGHALQRDGLKVTFRELVPFKQEMVALTQVWGVSGPKMSEGFAEFSRLYMTDPTLARQVAPTFYPWFEARLSTQPPLEAAVHAYRDEVLRLRALKPIERIRRGFAFERGGVVEAGPPKTMGEKLRYGMRRLITDYWNRAVPLREVVEAIDPTGNLLAAANDPHKRYKTLGARIAAVGGSFIKNGIVDAQTGRVLPGSKGYYDIVQPVAEHQEDYTIYEMIRKIQDLETSAVPEHRNAAQNLTKLFDISAAELIRARQDLERQYPHFAGVLDELQTFNDGVLQYLIDTGHYSQKAIDTIRNSRDIYVPLGRLMDQGEVGAGADAFMVGRPLRRIRGTSQRIVLPTLVERARQIYTIVGAAERNLVAAKLADALESAGAAGQMLGTYMDKVTTPVSVTTTQIGAFRDTIQVAFIKAGGDPAVFDHVDWSTLVQIFQPDLSNIKRNQIVIWRNGEAEVWEVYDQAMMLALRQMDRSMVRPWVDAMGWGASVMYKMATAPVRWLHGGVVHAPDFVVAHLTRQVQEEAAQGYFMPRFIAGTIGKDIEEIKRRWRAGGGQVFHFVSLDSQSIQRNLDDLRFGHWYEGGVRRTARELFARFDDVTRWFDQAGRVGVARTVIQNPRAVDVLAGELSVNIDAAFKAREAGGDYEQAGNSVFWRFFSSTIPFVRAAQTHIYRTNRNFKEAFDAVRRRDFDNQKVRGILVTGGAMLLLEMLTYLYLADDVRWKQTEDWEKSLYYHWTWPWQERVTQTQWDAMTEAQKKAVPGLARAPKSFFMSWLFATLPRQVSEYAHDNDPEAFNKMLEKLAESFLLSNHMTLWPGALKPIYDIKANKNPLSGAPLNPRRLEGLPPEEQAQFYTPEVARRASEILQKIPVVKNLHLTPIDIDHLVRGYTGYAGQYTEAALDSLGRMLSGKEAIELPATRWYEQMAIRRLVSRFPNARTQQLNDFYSAYHESQETLALLRQKLKEGKSGAEIERLKADREFDPEMTGQLMGAARMFNFYRKSMENVVRSQRDAETKREEVDRLLRLELDTATKVMDLINKKRLERAAVPAQ